VVAVKVHLDACFLKPHLASGLLLWRGREESTGISKHIVVETKVSQSAGSKASLALVGRMVPSQERGFQKRTWALALSAYSSKPFISTQRVSPVRLPCGVEAGRAGVAPLSL
jgi:hypothetical protein